MTDDDKPFTWGLTPGSEPEPPPAESLPAAPSPPTEPYFPPTEPYTPPTEVYRSPAQPYVPPALKPPLEPPVAQWFAAPLDPDLEGVTEVFEAELIGPIPPPGEGLEPSGIDDLFGEHQFQDVSNEPFIAPVPPRQSAGTGGAKPPRPPRAGIPRSQKILMGIAGGLVAALALVALFQLGTMLPSVLAAAPTASPTPTPTRAPAFIVIPAGPVSPGEHRWNDLLGGECLSPYESPWQDTYTVVGCTVPHPAQMVFRGTFPDAASAAYPGVAELQKRINLLCTAPTIVNYAIAGTVRDIQVAASFAADADQWASGDRTFFCFANRSGGEPLLASIAIQQVAVTMTPTPAP
jgi:hypothetical protein